MAAADIIYVDSPQEYRLDRASVFKYQLGSAAALMVAVFVLSKPLADGQLPGVLGSVLGAGVLGAACWWLLAFRPSRYAIELSASGVRRSADGKWAPWSSLGSHEQSKQSGVRCRKGTRATRVRPPGADPFELYAKIRAELRAHTSSV
jgi:hypothetical protein